MLVYWMVYYISTGPTPNTSAQDKVAKALRFSQPVGQLGKKGRNSSMKHHVFFLIWSSY